MKYHLKFMVLIAFCMIKSSLVWSHENIPSYLQIKVSDKLVQISFKYPIDTQGNQTVFLSFPASWKSKSSINSILDQSGILDASFEIEHLDGSIEIQRTSGSNSVLIVNLIKSGKNTTFIIDKNTTSWPIEWDSDSSTTAFVNFCVLGIEHILLGIDHLLFVLALLFLVKGKQLIGAITAFTIAHSITLAVSTLHIISIPSLVAEAMIAYSLILMASKMFKPIDRNNSRNYTVLAFVFGLLHGFGFAGVLADIGLPESNFILAIFSFNLGVEIGQVIFIGFILLILRIVNKYLDENSIMKFCSYIIGSLGAFWFLERTLLVCVG